MVDRETVPIAVLWPHLPERTRKIILAMSGIPHEGLADRAWVALPQHYRLTVVKNLKELV